MFKKSVAVLGVSAALLLGASSAAFADPYPPGSGPAAGDTTISVGEGTTITVTGVGNEVNVTFIVVNSPGGASLASIVPASARPSVTKVPQGDSASAAFSAATPGDHTVAVEGASGADYGSVTINVAGTSSGSSVGSGSSGGSDDGLAATGGAVPAAALWLGVGAIGIGGIAVAAVVARRRAANNR